MFKVILPRVANVPRNYIIDQTNMYKNARKCKLRPFSDYQKVAIYLFLCWSFEDEFTIELVIYFVVNCRLLLSCFQSQKSSRDGMKKDLMKWARSSD